MSLRFHRRVAFINKKIDVDRYGRTSSTGFGTEGEKHGSNPKPG